MGERNTLFESMWNNESAEQEMTDNYERDNSDDPPHGRTVADAIADIHRATLDALIAVSRPEPPRTEETVTGHPHFAVVTEHPPYSTIGRPSPFVADPYSTPYAHRAFRRHPDDLFACIHRNCPICRAADEIADAPPIRPRRCTACGATITPHSGIFYNDANGFMCRTCAAARGDAAPARQPAPPPVADAHANDGVLADDHDDMLDEPEVAAPDLGSLDGAGSIDEPVTSLDEHMVSEHASPFSKPSAVPVPDLSRGLPTASAGPCFHCGQPTLASEYCYGCKANICLSCDGLGRGVGGHAPQDHLTR